MIITLMFAFVKGTVRMEVSGAFFASLFLQREFKFIRAVAHDLAMMRKPLNRRPSIAGYTRRDENGDKALGVMRILDEYRRLKTDRDNAPRRNCNMRLLGLVRHTFGMGTRPGERVHVLVEEHIYRHYSRIVSDSDADMAVMLTHFCGHSIPQLESIGSGGQRFKAQIVRPYGLKRRRTRLQPRAVLGDQRFHHASRCGANSDDAILLLGTGKHRRALCTLHRELVLKRGIRRLDLAIDVDALFKRLDIMRTRNEIRR